MRAIILIGVYLLLHVTPAFAVEPIKLGGTLGLTGKYKHMSIMVSLGIKLWVKQTNENGGLLGRPVELILYDDTSRADVAHGLYERLIHEDKVDLVFGPYSSVITKEIMKVCEPHGFSVLASGATSDQLWQQGYKHLFGVYIPASLYSYGFLKLLLRHDIHQVAVVYPNGMFSKTVADGAEKWAKLLGMTVTLKEQFSKGNRRLEELALKIQASGAEAIIMGGHYNESVDMRVALRNIGWQPKAYFATLGPAQQKYYDVLQGDGEGTFTLANWDAKGVSFPGAQQFAEDFMNEYHEQPAYQAAAGYAVGQILATAILRNQSLDRKQLRDTLSSLDTMTVLGRYGVDSTGQQVRHFSLVMQWQEQKLRIVAPVEVKAITAFSPVFH